jgi:hypothetical protein
VKFQEKPSVHYYNYQLALIIPVALIITVSRMSMTRNSIYRQYNHMKSCQLFYQCMLDFKKSQENHRESRTRQHHHTLHFLKEVCRFTSCK